MERFTVGIGGDYANWRAAWDYLRTVDPLTDDYEFRQISDVTENAWASPVGAELDLDEHSVKFYVDSADAHRGDPTRGYITYLSGATGRIWFMNLAGPGDPGTRAQTFIVENLYLRQLTATNIILLDIGPSWANGGNLSVEVTNVMVRGHGIAQADGIRIGSDLVYAQVKNCKVWNIGEGIILWGGSGVATPGRRFLENCTVAVHGSRGFFLGTLAGGEWAVRNCVSISGLGINIDWRNANYSRHTVRNCASEDATCAGNHTENCITGIVPADEFQYSALADDDQSNFLKLIEGTVLKNGYEDYSPQLGRGGTTPRYATDDIAGNARP